MNEHKERDLFSVKSTKKIVQKSKKKAPKSAKKRRALFKKKTVDDVKDSFEDFHTDSISYESICEGHVMLGCVLQIRRYEMVLSLPNRMVGYVPITNISNSYKNLLSAISKGQEPSEKVYDLTDLYRVGQLLITKVKNVLTGDLDRKKVILSIMPSDTNRTLKASLLQSGSLLQAAISEETENGFVIETGIVNVRGAFLPKDAAPPGICGVGKVFLCCVHSVMLNEDDQVRIKLSANPDFMSKQVVSLGDPKGAMTTIIPGVIVRTTVLHVQKEGLLLAAPHNKVFVGANHLVKFDQSPKDYAIGSEVTARVLFVTDFTNSLHCTLNKRLCDSNIVKELKGDIDVGDIIENAEIYTSGNEGVNLRLPNDQFGFCSANRLQDSFIDPKVISERYAVGSAKNCRIIYANLIDQLFIVSLQKSLVSGEVLGIEDLSVGQKLRVKVLEHNNYGAVVQISPTVNGFIQTMHLTDTSMSHPEKKCPVGQSFNARIIRHHPGRNPYLTLKNELVTSSLPILSSLDQSFVGVTTIGTVVRHYFTGFLVEFFGEAKAFVPVREMPVQLRPNFDSDLPIGVVVHCRIVSVDKIHKKMTASLLLEAPERKMEAKGLELYDVVSCTVICIKGVKVFVSIKGRKDVKAFINKMDLRNAKSKCDSFFKTLKKGRTFKKAAVIHINKNTVTLSLKSKYMVNDSTNSLNKNENGDLEQKSTGKENVESSSKSERKAKKRKKSEQENDESGDIKIGQKTQKTENGESDDIKVGQKTQKTENDESDAIKTGQKTQKTENDEADDIKIGQKTQKTKSKIELEVKKPKSLNQDQVVKTEIKTNSAAKKKRNLTTCLPVASSTFDWFGRELETTEDGQSVSSSSDEDDQIEAKSKEREKKSVKKLNRAEREQLYSAAERKTRELELQRLDSTRQPETAYDFEEKIERTPHSASAWIEYVSFHLENAETEKGRSVASRALTIIPSRLEEERLAIWNVLLRLEVMYGSANSVETAFKEAIITNDELKIFYIMIEVYRSLNKFKEAEEVVKTMTKKFSQNKEVWIKAGMLFYQAKNLTSARSTLDKSLISLPKQEHVDVINRFAQFEIKFGDPERGRTIFETLLSNYPKRLDVWHVYADLLTKNGDIPEARNVLERMTGLKLRINAMRGVFKKLLEFERIHGTPQRVEAVKTRVEEFVAAAIQSTQE